jgi:hypothetical protein
MHKFSQKGGGGQQKKKIVKISQSFPTGQQIETITYQ